MGNKESRLEETSDNMAAFDRWLNQRLQKYFEDMETMVLDVKMTPETRKDIRDAVEEMIGNIFKEAEQVDGRIRVKKSGLMKVGNFYEDTQVICVDEIELYTVLEHLSGEDTIQVENTTNEYFETLHVCVREKFVPQWEDCIVDDPTKQGLVSAEKLVVRVHDVLETAVAGLRKRAKDVIYKKHGYLELMNDGGISKRGSSICLKFDWTGGIFFSVIVTPVLKLNKTESYILHNEVLSEMVFEATSACGSVLLVPEMGTSADNYFRLSLAHTECYLMNKDVSSPHRRVYRILQFLVNGYKKKEALSYQLLTNEQVKTLVIMHDTRCGKKNTIGECVMEIVNKMVELLEGAASEDAAPSENSTILHQGKLFLPSIFVEHMNIFRQSAASAGKDIVNLNLSAISKLREHLVNDVGRSPSYVFGDVILKLVPVNQFILNADYHARKSRVNLVADGDESPAPEF